MNKFSPGLARLSNSTLGNADLLTGFMKHKTSGFDCDLHMTVM